MSQVALTQVHASNQLPVRALLLHACAHCALSSTPVSEWQPGKGSMNTLDSSLTMTWYAGDKSSQLSLT